MNAQHNYLSAHIHHISTLNSHWAHKPHNITTLKKKKQSNH